MLSDYVVHVPDYRLYVLVLKLVYLVNLLGKRRRYLELVDEFRRFDERQRLLELGKLGGVHSLLAYDDALVLVEANRGLCGIHVQLLLEVWT